MTNKVLYIGITSNLYGRVRQHKMKINNGFTSRYNVGKLVYYEDFSDVYDAIAREKELKRWHRQWKINQIKSINSNFDDLAREWY